MWNATLVDDNKTSGVEYVLKQTQSSVDDHEEYSSEGLSCTSFPIVLLDVAPPHRAVLVDDNTFGQSLLWLSPTKKGNTPSGTTYFDKAKQMVVTGNQMSSIEESIYSAVKLLEWFPTSSKSLTQRMTGCPRPPSFSGTRQDRDWRVLRYKY